MKRNPGTLRIHTLPRTALTAMALLFGLASFGIAMAEPIPAGTPAPQTPAPIPGLLFRVNAGGPAIDGYTADADFTGGTPYVNNSHPVSTGSASFPAPAAVYNSAREGSQFTYTFSGLTPQIGYTVILHFAELYWNAPHQRRFNVSINGTPELTDFDIVEMAGSFNAIDTLFFVRADVNGKINIAFTKGTVDQPTINAIEIRANNG